MGAGIDSGLVHVGRAISAEELALIEETVELRVTSRDWDALMRIIRERAETMLAQGRGETLERWLDALPPRRRQASPWMLYWLASCRLPTAPRLARTVSILLDWLMALSNCWW